MKRILIMAGVLLALIAGILALKYAPFTASLIWNISSGGAWQNQFAVTLTQNTLLTLLLLFVFALFAVFRSVARPLLPYFLRTRRAVENNLAPTHALLRSLALLEHSPTSA